VLEEQQLVGNAIRLARRHQLLLEREPFCVRDDAETANLKRDDHGLRR
jgi:hypothetical protein